MNQQARAREKTTASAAEQQFRLLADALPQIVWTANPEGAIQYFNQRWFDFTGISFEEAQGSGWQSAIHADDLQIYLDRWNKSLRTGETCEVEFRLRRASDASYHWQLSRALPWKENGRVTKWFGTITDVDLIVCRDLTERKQEELFRTGQSHVLEMIARGEPLESVLASLMLLIEAQADEMLCSILLLSDDGAHVRHGAAPSLPLHYVKAVDGAPIGPKNGSCGTAMYLAKPVIVTDIFTDPLWEDYRGLAEASGLRACWSTPILSGSGKVLGSFAMYYRQPQSPSGSEAKLTEVATHIAGIAIERQRWEDELRRTQGQLAHVARVTTMGELTASIAHEVNQPLGAIVGNADICIDWLAGEHPDLSKVAEALEDISRDGHRASEVISRIRGLAKKQLPQKSTLDINEVAREAQALVNHEANMRGVTLLTEFGAELPTVSGDRVQLQQVLLNLLMNGMDSMTTTERQRRRLTLSTNNEEDKALVAVCDCGVGIEQGQAEQVFKAFHSTKSGGMGMGLAISRSIIEAHGGRLWLEPNEGPGVTFKFTLPSRVAEAEA
jgi:PAS domain S-box-containing protein